MQFLASPGLAPKHNFSALLRVFLVQTRVSELKVGSREIAGERSRTPAIGRMAGQDDVVYPGQGGPLLMPRARPPLLSMPLLPKKTLRER
jgi:hypothetical protein